MSECCETCKRRLDLQKWDYSKPHVPKEKLDGFACMLFASEGLCIQMVGADEKNDRCEGYVKREVKE